MKPKDSGEGGSIKIFREAQIHQVFVVAVVAKIGVMHLVLVDQASEECVGEIVADPREACERNCLAGICLLAGVRTRETNLRSRPGGNRKLESGPILNAGKTVASQIPDVIARNESVRDDLRPDDLTNIVADRLADLVVESVDRPAVIERLLGVWSGLMPEEDSPQKAVLIVAKVVANSRMELQLVGDRSIHAGEDDLIETVLHVRLQCLIDNEWLESQIFPLGNKADVDLVPESWKPAIALVVPKIFVRHSDAQPRFPDDQSFRLRADDIAEVDDIQLTSLFVTLACLRHRRSPGTEAVSSGPVNAIETAACEKHGIATEVVRIASDANGEFVRKNDVPTADNGIPGDLGTEDWVLAETKNERRVEAETCDACFVFERQINEGAGNRETQTLRQLRDDRAANRDNGDDSSLPIVFSKVDIVAPQGGGGEIPQLEEYGTYFEVGILRFESPLEQRNAEAKRWEAESRAGLDGFGLY